MGAVDGFLVVLRQPLSHFGCPDANYGILARLVCGSTGKDFGSDYPLFQVITLARERAFDDVCQQRLTLSAAPERRTLKNMVQSLPDPDSVGVS